MTAMPTPESPKRHRSSQDSVRRYETDSYRYDERQNEPLQHSESTNQKPSTKQPIKERVDAVVNGDSGVAAAHDVPPELVAQITEQVINSLRKSGINSSQSPPTVRDASPPPPQPAPLAPPSNGSTNSKLNYAPTTPKTDNTPHGASIETRTASDHNPSSSTYQPPQDGYSERESRVHKSNASADQGITTSKISREEPNRPTAPVRVATDDATTLEKIWQRLFDVNGQPTERLGEFLRGVAIHIIEDYDPPNSLVIPPRKMLQFYKQVHIGPEKYPWELIFGGGLKNSSISHLYRDLSCEHHFIQQDKESKPTVPALTPHGFQEWMTRMIRANPDGEFQRFTKAVLNMPISNASNRKERFPKELSRRLFPKSPDRDILSEVEYALLSFEEIEFPPASDTPITPDDLGRHSLPQEGPPSRTQYPQTTDTGVSFAKGKQSVDSRPIPPHAASAGSAVRGLDSNAYAPPPAARMPRVSRERSMSDDEDELVAAKPIERERKPYHAQPGLGKAYDEVIDGGQLRQVKSESPPILRAPLGKPDSPPTSRTSMGNQSLQPPLAPLGTRNTAPEPDDYHDRRSRARTETYAAAPSSQQQQQQRRRRSRSSHSNPYTRSDGDVGVLSTPAAPGPSGPAAYRPVGYVPEGATPGPRLHPGDAHRRHLDEDVSRSYSQPSSHRQQQGPGEAIFAPPPPPPPPPTQSSTTRSSIDDDGYKRRSMVNTPLSATSSTGYQYGSASVIPPPPTATFSQD